MAGPSLSTIRCGAISTRRAAWLQCRGSWRMCRRSFSKTGLGNLHSWLLRAEGREMKTRLFRDMHLDHPPVRCRLAVRDALIRTVLVMIASVSLVTGCKEQLESHYPTVNAAAQAGAFKRGWLPGVLQPDATDMREWHDLDSNEVRGRFALNDSVLHRLQSDCRESQEKPPTGTGPSWWPHTVDGATAASRHVVRCDNFFVSTYQASGVGYFWANGR